MPDFKSVDLVNAILADASSEYQSRVPLATQDNLAQVGTAIMDYTVTRNEFVNSLLNRIGLVIIKNKLFTNPLKEFKAGTLEWGKSIEEVFVDIIKAEVFDQSIAESELFKRNMPNVQSCFHEINREDQYKTTVSNNDLKRAFTSDNGFTNLIDKIIQALYTSDEIDEFLLMKHLIYQYGIEGKFAMVVVAPVVDEPTAKSAMVKIKEISNNLTFPKTDYNHAGVTTNTQKSEQIVLIDTAFDALVDVEVLASAFNMEKADFIGRRILIDDFGGLTNVLCAVVDRDFFMVYDSLVSSEEIYNPQGMYYNYFLNHWQVMSTSRFANAVLFVTVAPTLTSITLTPATATVQKTKSLQLVVEAVGTNNPPSKVTYTQNGTDSYISTSGLLIVGKNESVAGGIITVTATSTFDATKTATCAVTVV